jgi:hypothetical protein
MCQEFEKETDNCSSRRLMDAGKKSVVIKSIHRYIWNNEMNYYCSFQNKRRIDIFWISFHRSKIESCAFHYWKEEMETYQTLHYKIIWHSFLKDLKRHFTKRTYSVKWLELFFNNFLCIWTTNRRSIKLYAKPWLLDLFVHKL